jgi:hypothetical protein
MKICITTRFSTALQDRKQVESLCAAVRAAGMDDFCFVRDVENYRHVFDDPRELWQRTRNEILACNALLIDVSDAPTGGRVIEAGMAFGANMPVVVIARTGTEYKQIFDGIATGVIFYDEYEDVTAPLQKLLAI